MLVVDNGSAFTKDISGLLESRGADFVLEPFDRVDPELVGGYGSFVLSGRTGGGAGGSGAATATGGRHRRMNALNARIVRHCVHRSKKLLGICYGAELLALALGGTIRRASSPRLGSETVVTCRQNPLASGSLRVYESHAYELARLGPQLEQVASSESCRYEIVRHKGRMIFGTQFHPEMTADGNRLLGNFLDL